MPSVATGANLGNQDLLYLGVSGDGDTAGIGIGQFMHAARRQLNITYIVENNGTYGLTKGQFSATNDQGSKSKYGEENVLAPIDLAAMAIQLGAGFVGRSFSGDKDQLVPLLKAAMKFKGFSLIDIISPCVTFNNHVGSTKSYDYIREHNESDISRVIEMAWEDRTPFDAIEAQFGLNEQGVKQLMRDNLKSSSYRSWRKRVQGRSTKHLAKRGFRVGRHKSYDQNKL